MSVLLNRRSKVIGAQLLILIGSAIVVAASSSCGSLDFGGQSDKGKATLETTKVSGIFAEWGDASRSYAGGNFVLIDAVTSEAFWASVGDDGAFAIDSVPKDQLYYGILLGPDFRALARIESPPSASGSRSVVFALGRSGGMLGNLTSRGTRISSSHQDELEFEEVGQGALGVIPEAPVPFLGARPAVPGTNSDLDQDGWPNIIDGDWDGDGIPNVLDESVFSDVTNSNLSWEDHPGLALGGFGYMSCSWLAGVSVVQHRCVLKAPPDVVTGGRLQTFETEVDLQASPASQRSDLFTVDFSREPQAASLMGRLALVKLTTAKGLPKGYVIPLGEAVPYRFVQTQVRLVGDVLTVDLDVDGWDQPAGVQLQVVVSDSERSWTRVVEAPVQLPTTSFAGIKGWPMVVGSGYLVKVRLVFPAPLGGMLGSALETAEIEGVEYRAD